MNESSHTRRQFLRKSALGASLMAAGLAALGILRFIIPGLTRDRVKVDIGNATDYPVNTFTLLRETKLFVFRDHQGLRVVSAECTHLGCILDSTEDGFLCPCHGSAFTREGKVRFGPAPRSLTWYKVELAVNNRLIVNRRISVTPQEKLIVS